MSEFTDSLKTEWHPEIGEWRIIGGFRFYSGEIGSGLYVDCPDGMWTDLASIPIGVRWLIPKVGKDAQGAVVHDKIYQDGYMMVDGPEGPRKVPVNRGMADAMYLQAMKALGVKRSRMFLIYRGLQAFGWYVWDRYRNAGGISTETTR